MIIGCYHRGKGNKVAIQTSLLSEGGEGFGGGGGEGNIGDTKILQILRQMNIFEVLENNKTLRNALPRW